LIELDTNRLFARQLVVAVLVLFNQLSPYFSRAQTSIETSGLKSRVSLAVLIYDGFDVVQQVWQMLFCSFAPTISKAINMAKTAFQLLLSFADGIATPIQFCFCLALAPFTQSVYDTSHEYPAGVLFQVISCYSTPVFGRF